MKITKSKSKLLIFLFSVLIISVSVFIFMPRTEFAAEATSGSNYKVGDFVTGFYYNTALNPQNIFDAMDWSKAQVKVYPSDQPELATMGYIEMDVYYLISGFTPPTVIQNPPSDGTEWLQLQVWRWVKDNGTVSYCLMQHGSHGIWIGENCPMIGPHVPAGWWYTNTEFDNLDYSDGVTAVYVADEQNLWGQLVGKQQFNTIP